MWASSKAAEMGIQAQDPGQCMNSFERCTHLPIPDNVRDYNDFSSSITGFELNDGLNRDLVVTEAAANATDHAW